MIKNWNKIDKERVPIVLHVYGPVTLNKNNLLHKKHT